MFSLKKKWIRFASSIDELESLTKVQEIVPIQVNGGCQLLIKHQNEFYLISDTCPHQGSKLNHAKCEEGKIVCPWHHYGFDLKTGRGAGLYLNNYPIEIREDGIYAGFEYFSWFG